MSRRRKVVIFCHASPKVGLGNLRRCALLHQAFLNEKTFETEFVIFGEERSWPWLAESVEWKTPDLMSKTFDKKLGSDVWILDFNPAKVTMQDLLNWCGIYKSYPERFLVAMDQLKDLASLADLLFVPCFYPGPTRFSNLSFGWDHYILPAFPKVKPLKQILVLPGGSDSLEWGRTLPSILEHNVPEDWNLAWVTGPYAPSLEVKFSSRWRQLINPPSLPERIAESSFVLTPYGVSFFEALKAGTFPILLETQKRCDPDELRALQAEIQVTIARELEDLPQVLAPLLAELESGKTISSILPKNPLLNACGEQLLIEKIRDNLIFPVPTP